MGVETGLVTFAEFEALPDPPSGHCELHHGRVVLMPPRKKIHMQIQQMLMNLLAPVLHDLGFLATEFGFRAAPEYESWQCDIGFVPRGRWNADHNDYFLGAPDFAIEVLSRSNTMDEMLERQYICLANGCRAFWIVDPQRQTVMVTTPDRKTAAYDRSSFVPLPEPYDGALEVAAIFRL